MRIRTNLLLGVGASIVLILIFSFVVYTSFNKVAQENERELIATQVQTATSKLVILMDQYLSGRTSRSVQQWNSLHDNTVTILEKRSEQELDLIKKEFTAIKPLFVQVVDNYENTGQAGSELEKRLVSQILIKSDTIVLDSSAIGTDAYNSAVDAQARANLIMFVSLGILIIILFGISYYTSRKISNPVNKLSQQVDEVSKGNFKVKIEKSNIQEVNMLAESLSRIMKTMKLAVMEKEPVKTEKKPAPAKSNILGIKKSTTSDSNVKGLNKLEK